jgi:8-oxo-dGTP pyrophosphatase MutT (NUDIX family)
MKSRPDELQWAAVALIVTPDPEAFLLIRRADRADDPWSGHLALPGGRQHEGDADLLATAIRETREEVGVILEPTNLAGTLGDVVPRTPVLPPLAIRPFVFNLLERPPVVPNPEVAGTAWVELAPLRLPDARHEIAMEIRGQRRLFPAYHTPVGSVWGLTERILSLLLAQTP